METWIVVEGWDARERLRFSRWENGQAVKVMKFMEAHRQVRSGSYVSHNNARKATRDWCGSIKNPKPERSGFFSEIWHANLDEGTVTMVERVVVP